MGGQTGGPLTGVGVAGLPAHLAGIGGASSWGSSTSPRTRSPTAACTLDPAAGRRARARPRRRRAPTSSTSAGSRPAPAPRRPRSRRSCDRVLPGRRRRSPSRACAVSVDTMRAEVARAAVAAGAVLVNDVSGGRADPRMLATVADLGVPYVLMHWRAHSATMQQHTTYGDVVGDVTARAGRAARRRRGRRRRPGPDRGRPGHRLLQDRRPELGAARPGSTRCTPWAARCWSAPAASASSASCSPTADELRPPRERDDASTAAAVLAAAPGAWCVRTHEVRRRRRRGAGRGPLGARQRRWPAPGRDRGAAR